MPFGDPQDAEDWGGISPELRAWAKLPNAVTSLHTGGKKREQEVHTPDWILDAVREAFGGTIYLDPCAATKIEAHFQVDNLNPVFRTDGLVEAWDPRGTFFNPPFNNLRPWLEKAVHERGKTIGLFPFRPHRRWFLPLVETGTTVFLNYNVRFKGFDHAFPAPLVLVSWRCEIPHLGPRETGRW